MRNTLSILLVMGCAVIALSPVLAQAPPAMPSEPMAVPLQPSPCIVQSLRMLSPATAQLFASRLSLTDEQKTKVQDLLTKAEDALKPKIEAQRKAAEEFVVAMAKPETDQAALLTAADKADKAEMAILTEKINTLYEIKALLDDKQKTELGKLIGQRTGAWRGERTRVPLNLILPTTIQPKPDEPKK